MASDGAKILTGVIITAGAVSRLLTIPILTLLALLWVLHLPAPHRMVGAAAAPEWVKSIVGSLYQFLQRNIEDTKKKEMEADLTGCDADKLLWHFSFGANMDPQILSGRRKVTPKQTKTCCVEGYQLLFSHRGLPYWEPSFATISRVQAEGSPGTNGSATDSRDGAQPTTGPAGADILLSGTANGHTPNGSCPPRQAAGTQGGALGAARRALLALGSFALGKQTLPPVAPRQFVTKGEGRAAVHGVVHQITTANMAQIRATEGGGGHDNMGYTLENVECTLYDGSVVTAVAFTTHVSSTMCQSVSYAHPSQRYLHIMQRGARHAKLDPSYVQWLQQLQPYCWVTVGQVLAAWGVLAAMLGLGYALAGALTAHRLLLRRKMDSLHMHRYFQVVIDAVWKVHNAVLQHALGRGC